MESSELDFRLLPSHSYLACAIYANLFILSKVLTPAIKDPYLIWIWAGPAIALFVQTVIFWFRYKHLNNDEFMVRFV